MKQWNNETMKQWNNETMEQLIVQSFRTNIKCGGCVSKVRPFLDGAKEIHSWRVDLNSQDRVLTVEGDISSEFVVKIIAAAGYKADLIE